MCVCAALRLEKSKCSGRTPPPKLHGVPVRRAPRSGFFQELGFFLRVKTRLPIQSLRSDLGWVCLDFHGFDWISMDFLNITDFNENPWFW